MDGCHLGERGGAGSSRTPTAPSASSRAHSAEPHIKMQPILDDLAFGTLGPDVATGVTRLERWTPHPLRDYPRRPEPSPPIPTSYALQLRPAPTTRAPSTRAAPTIWAERQQQHGKQGLLMAVYDASWQRPAPSKLKPGDGIILYASRTDAKCPTIAECDAYRARGVKVRFVFEDAADRAASTGYAAGKADGALTSQQVKVKGGQAGDAVYFACDTYKTIRLDYATGFRDGLTTFFEPRLYAGDRNLELVRVQLGMTLGWQAAAGSWSDHFYKPGQVGGHGTYPYASLWQVIGTSAIPDTDINIVNNPAWVGGNGDNMTPEEVQTIADAVWGRALTPPGGGLSIAAGDRLAETDRHVSRLTRASSGNVWDENITGADGTVVDAAKDRLANVDHATGIDLPAQIKALSDKVDTLTRLVQSLLLPSGAPVSYTMTGTLEPKAT